MIKILFEKVIFQQGAEKIRRVVEVEKSHRIL